MVDRIWINSYEKGVNFEIDVKKYSSISNMLDEIFQNNREKIAFSNFGVDFTYAQIKELTDYFASYLQNELHLKKGDRVSVMMPNLIQYPIVVFAILQAGFVVVNVNPLYTAPELKHQLIDSGSNTVIIVDNFLKTLEAVIDETPVKNVITTKVGDLLGFKGKIINLFLKYIKKAVPDNKLKNSINLIDAIEKGKNHKFKPIDISLEDTAFLQYTGGTTGISKGAILTNENICANLLQAEEWTKIIRKEKGSSTEVVITPLPLYHIFSLTINLFLMVKIGARNILITDPRDIKGLIKTLNKYSFTLITGVNTLFNALVNEPLFKSVNFSSLKICLGGGAAVQEAVAKKWQKITNVPITEAYGLTEASPGVCVNLFEIDYTGTIGYPISMTDVDIRDDEGKSLPIGEVGELHVKGPQVMKGYWNKPEETAKALKDGWLSTGDLGYFNKDGSVKLVDRKKDMVIVSGFNVYPNEIEDVVVSHPGIKEAACIGVPSEKTGEALKLFIVLNDKNLTKEAIIKFCRKSLTGYKVPRIIEFVDDLPKSPIGKVLRKELRKDN